MSEFFFFFFDNLPLIEFGIREAVLLVGQAKISSGPPIKIMSGS